MRAVLLAAAASIAAITSPFAPVQAQQFVSGQRISWGPGTPAGPVIGQPSFRDGCFDRFHHHDGADRDGRHRRDRVRCDTSVVMDYYGGEWALYNNRSWEPNSYNDWWHDNPGRAYPAWMRHNEHCDRMWWSGDTLIC